MEKAQVLIVEDDGIIAMDLESRMKQLGYGVTGVAGYGERAIEKVKENTPDVVLMDIILKGEMDGIEAAEEIRTQYDIPVIFITGYADKDRLKRAKLAYPFGFILKPFSDKDLEVTIEMALYVAKVDSKRKQAEETLQESENQLRMITDNIPAYVAYVDSDLYFRFVNKTYEKVFNKPRAEIIGKHATEVMGETHFDKIQEKIQMALTGQEVFYESLFLIGEEQIFLTVAYVPETDEKGVTKGYFILANDITERKQAEEVLHQYEHIVSSSTDMLALLDKRFKYLAANKAYIEAFKLTPEQLIGNTVADVFGEEFFNTVIKPNADRCLGGEEVNYQDWFEFPAYERRYMDITYHPYYNEDNKIIGVVVNGRNITDRKLVEEKLQQKTHDIGERVKELNCLYSISRLVDRSDISLDEVLQGVVDIIPPSWQYPDVTCSRILLNGKEYETENFKETNWKQTSDIFVLGELMGSLDVCYLEEKPEIDEGPFLKEERSLINAITERLGRIIERKQAEEALIKSEIFLNATGQIAKVGGWQIDGETKQVFWTKEIYNITEVPNDYDPSSIEKKAIVFFSAEDQLILEKAIQRAFEHNEPYDMEFQITTAKGNKKWVQTICEPFVVDGKVVKLGGTFQDITERKQTEETLRKSEEEYRVLIKNLPSIVYRGYKDWSIEFIDNKIGLLTGYDADEFNSNRMKWIDIIVEEDIENAQESFIQALKTDKSYVREYRIRSKTGDIFWIQERGHIVCDSKGKIEIVSGVFFDITERKQIENEKAKLEVQLQQSQKMESIGTLAGGIAHDFNNILFPIIGFAEMAREDTSEGSSLRNSINEILHGAKRAGDLVKQILTFSRQAGQELKPLQVQLVIKEVLKLIKSTLPSTIEIKQYVSKKCGLVLADPSQIHQIAMNLITNAYHAMEDEGGKLEVTLKEVELGIDDLTDPSMATGTYACLTVADTGPGMDQSVISRIFEPYFTTKENGKGTGLGLAVVHGIVKSYKGDIRVYSETGEGTAFHVYLPVIKSQFETEEADTVAPVPKGTERILLVDDEDPIVRMEKQMLERLGYDVTERTSSIEALEAFRATPDKFDLVITDTTMPNMTGIQLSQKLLEIRPDIPIIICTGFSTKIDDEKAKAAGIRGYVMKPVIMSEIAKKIREVLDQE